MLPALLILTNLTAAQPAAEALRPVPFTAVEITGGIWAERQRVNRERTVRANFEQCEATGRIANFENAARKRRGEPAGEFQGWFFNDSDVYKAIQGAAYVLHAHPDPELDRYLDDLIAIIAAAQEENGYLNTYYTLKEGLDKRWTNLKDMHELYCAGHLIEAGIAHHEATGKQALLDAAIRFADLIDSIFGPGKRRDVPGHEEIELALIKLARHTGERRYSDLAAFFVEERGRADGRDLYGEYCQDHLPLRDHDHVVGHAVRAMYLYSAAAEVAAETGDRGYIDAMDRVWRDLVHRKMYITGGIGASSRNEGFTDPFDLPNERAYAETCAGIGLVMWNHRLNLLHRDAKYADVMERGLYNNVLSGVSLGGDTFFYTNPLASRGAHHRRPWYAVACCPPNILRTVASVGGYVYAQADDTLVVNLYTPSVATVDVGGTSVRVTQATEYPWHGEVRITLEPERDAEFAVWLRIPDWAREAEVRVNGRVPDAHGPAGHPAPGTYTAVGARWTRGDVIEISLPMPVERVRAHPSVEANRGLVALQRGPVVYCLEGADNGGTVSSLTIPPTATINAEHRRDLLGGVTVLRGVAYQPEPLDWSESLYHAPPPPPRVEFTAVPYCVWDNRAPGEMAVWIPESPGLVEPPLDPTIRASASHCWGSDTLTAMYDRKEPQSSGDQEIPRFTWWPRKGSTEWAALEFTRPRRVSEVSLYWFDDTGAGGGCAVPLAWRLLYLDENEWRPVEVRSPFGVEPDRFNRLRFTPVTTTGLKIEAELRPDRSGGILEWRID